ncbi:MAG: hypothetical protein ACRYG8_11415 [Janthinobacterium lividum]
MIAVLSCCLVHPAAAASVPTNAGACSLQGSYLIFFAPNVVDPVTSTARPPGMAKRAAGLLDAVAGGWRHNPGPLLIAGHVDRQEMQHGVKGLDLARAEAVRRVLILRGVAGDALSTTDDGFRDGMLPGSNGPEIQNRFVSVTAPNAMADCPYPLGSNPI